METGTVKWFNLEKKYGFITRDNGKGDIFFHQTKVLESNYLKQDEKVQFNTVNTPKGNQAMDVKRVAP